MRGSFWGLRCRGWGLRFLVEGGDGKEGLDVDKQIMHMMIPALPHSAG